MWAESKSLRVGGLRSSTTASWEYTAFDSRWGSGYWRRIERGDMSKMKNEIINNVLRALLVRLLERKTGFE
jgi:hypothetical protein